MAANNGLAVSLIFGIRVSTAKARRAKRPEVNIDFLSGERLERHAGDGKQQRDDSHAAIRLVGSFPDRRRQVCGHAP